MITLKEMAKNKKDIRKIKISEEDKRAFAKKFKNIDIFKNLDDNGIFWAVFTLYLVWIQENENERLWKDFKEEIMYKSRFLPKSKLLKNVDNIYYYASVELCKGTVLYRAREYTNSDLIKNKEVISIYEKLNEFFPHLKLRLEDMESDSVINLISFVLMGDTNKIEELQRRVMEIVNEDKPFWGFDDKGCDAPPREFAKAGRANSIGVSFLYAASDKKTAIMEMRPQIGQCFNVCMLEICKNVRVFDLTYTAGELEENEFTKSEDLYSLSKEFSCPNYGNVNDYFPTQYLCEYLRQKGFDGIRYKSAVSPNGINVILFNTDRADRAYKIIESRVYNVKDMDIRFEQIIPYELENRN